MHLYTMQAMAEVPARPDHSAAIYFNKEPFNSWEGAFGKRAYLVATQI